MVVLFIDSLVLCFTECKLLSTHFTSSLSLMISGFGIENSNFLQEISDKDGVLRISGYISSPSDIFLHEGIVISIN